MRFRAICISAGALLLAVAMHGSAQAVSGKQAAFAAYMQKAQTFLREHRPELAIPELQAAVALQPDDVQAQGNLGVLLFFTGKPADAIPHLRAAIQAQPTLSKLQGILGIAELHVGETDQGRKDIQTVFPQVDDPKFKVQLGLELVSSLTLSGDLDQAAAVLAQLKKIAPDNPEILYAEYRTYTDLSGEARLQLSVAAPESAQTHQMLAHEELLEGNTNAAIAQYRKAIAIDPRLPDVHYELGELLNTAADPAIRKQAAQEFQIALRQNPYNEQALCSLAALALEKGEAEQAKQEYSRAVQIQPSDAGAHLGLAKALMYLNQSEKALPELQEAARLEPTDPVVHYRLALLDREAGHPTEARKEMELFSEYKAEKEKLRAVYRGLLIQPKQITAGDLNGK